MDYPDWLVIKTAIISITKDKHPRPGCKWQHLETTIFPSWGYSQLSLVHFLSNLRHLEIWPNPKTQISKKIVKCGSWNLNWNSFKWGSLMKLKRWHKKVVFKMGGTQCSIYRLHACTYAGDFDSVQVTFHNIRTCTCACRILVLN